MQNNIFILFFFCQKNIAVWRYFHLGCNRSPHIQVRSNMLWFPKFLWPQQCSKLAIQKIGESYKICWLVAMYPQIHGSKSLRRIYRWLSVNWDVAKYSLRCVLISRSAKGRHKSICASIWIDPLRPNLEEMIQKPPLFSHKGIRWKQQLLSCYGKLPAGEKAAAVPSTST